MKKIGEFKCPRCGWVHIGISEEDAAAEVAESASVERYLRCFKCGGPTHKFVPALPDDAPDGCTLQVVIAPKQTKSSA